MNFSIKTKQILGFLFFSFCVYAVVILIFAYLYFATGSIEMTSYTKPVPELVDFQKAIYFSIVSFHTIGFGDIHPYTDQGRMIVIIQSSISIFFTSLFSGLLVYFIIKRPKDLFITKRIYIRHRNEKFWLSIRVGNKGRTIIDVKSKFEAWTIEHNSRVRVFQIEQELPDLERILYFDLDLDNKGTDNLTRSIRRAVQKSSLLHMKFSFIGNDMRTGEQVAFAKYYDTRDLRYGTMFQNVYSWDKRGRMVDFRWKNFERISEMDHALKETFISQNN
jgi:hypothetical protein